MVGRSEDAEAIRREHVGLSARDNAALQNAHDTIVDHIMGGRPDLAVIRAREAVHRFPSARRIHAALAWALIEAGEVEEASFWLLREAQHGTTHNYDIEMVHIRWLIAMQEYDAAWELHTQYSRKRRLGR